MKQFKFILPVLGLLLFGCERPEEDFQGPALVDLFGEFNVIEGLEIADREVDFLGGETTYFTATFSKQVAWQIKITGAESGSVKIIEGFSSFVDNTNSTWSGTTTQIPLFRPEECTVELLVDAEEFSASDALTILSTKSNTGLLLTDFEDGIDSDWITFVQSGADMSFQIRDEVPAAEGNNYYDMGGEVNWDWLLGLLEFPATAYGAPTFALNSDPSQVYFNIMVYVPENIVNELLLIQFREDDNSDGNYVEGSEDMFSLELQAADLETGWQFISVNYAELPTLVNGQPAEGLGNGIYEAHKLNKVSVLFLADPASGYSQTFIDYLIFTEGGPLEP